MWNSRSLKSVGNFNNFKILLHQLNMSLDFIALSETWWEDRSKNLYKLAGYNLESVSRVSKSGGGIAIYIRNDHSYEVIRTFNGEYQKLVIKISSKHDTMTLVLYYRPPNGSNLNCFLDDVENELQLQSELTMIGDMNINIKNNNSDSQKYLDIVNSYNGKFQNEHQTFPSSGSLLDHVIIKGNSAIEKIHTIENSLSDHNLIIVTVDKPSHKVTKTIIKTKIDYDALRNVFAIDENDLVLYDPNKQVDLLVASTKAALEKASSSITYQMKSNGIECPWINYKIISLFKHRDNITRKIRKRKKKNLLVNELSEILESVKIKLLEEERKACSQYYHKKLTSTDRRIVWNTIKEVSGTEKNTSNNLSLKINGKLTSEEAAISEEFNSKFLPDDTQSQAQVDHDFNKYSTVKEVCETIFLSPSSPQEILEIIDSLDSNKSPGIDNINAKVIKELKHEMCKSLSIIADNIMTTGIYPDFLKQALVTPIFKKNDRLSASNYRPISILPSFNKIFEKILISRLDDFFNKQNIRDKNQFGFKSNCGTINALTELSDDITNSLDNGKYVAAVFLDIENAFGSVNHKILLDKLYAYGIRGNAHNLTKSYFSNRCQAVKIGRFVGKFKKITRGLGQGSNKGPVYFNILFDDFRNLQINAKSQRYADDNCFWFEFETEAEMVTRIREIMDIIYDFYKVNDLRVNDDKNAAVIFHRRTTVASFPNAITLENGSQLKIVDGHTYLGVFMDKNLTFKHHFESVCSRLRSVNATLYHLKHILPFDALLKIYFAQFHVHLYNATPLWGNLPDCDLKRLQTLQNRALKQVFNLPILTDTISLFKERAKGILPVRGVFIHATAILMHNLVHKKVPSSIALNFHSNNRRSDGQLVVAKAVTSFYGERKISRFGSRIYNALSSDLKSTTNSFTFKKKLKMKILENIDILFSNVNCSSINLS